MYQHLWLRDVRRMTYVTLAWRPTQKHQSSYSVLCITTRIDSSLQGSRRILYHSTCHKVLDSTANPIWLDVSKCV